MTKHLAGYGSKMKGGDGMRIGFIGAGKVGCTLGKYLKTNGRTVSGYFSRNSVHAREAAEFTDTLYYERINDLVDESDAVIITVSDNAIPLIYESLDKNRLRGKVIAHTSGAMSSSVFTDSENYGFYSYSIHPVYAVNDRFTSYENFQNAFITIEGSAGRLDEVTEYFRSLGNTVANITSDNKVRYHAAAVFASNLVCGLVGTAADMLISCGFKPEDAEKALKGLFLDNAKGISERGPAAQLTGPVERNDTETVRKHLASLTPEEKKLYISASLSAVKLAEKKHPDRDYEELRKILEDHS